MATTTRKKLADMTADELLARMNRAGVSPGSQTYKNARAALRRLTGLDNEGVGHFATSGLSWDAYQATGPSEDDIKKAVEQFQAGLAKALKTTTTPKAPKRARKEATMATTTTTPIIPGAEALIEGLGESRPNAKGTYSRLCAEGRTLAYANPRKDGLLLDFAYASVEHAPAKVSKGLERKGMRSVFHVTAKNVKAARALLEWVVANPPKAEFEPGDGSAEHDAAVKSGR